jgi:hypothetical protein
LGAKVKVSKNKKEIPLLRWLQSFHDRQLTIVQTQPVIALVLLVLF